MEAITKVLLEFEEKKIKLEYKEDKLDIISYGGIIDKDIIDKVKFHKKEIIEHLKSNNETKRLHISPVSEKNCYPLSSQQFRLWAVSQFQEASIAYNSYGYFNLDKNLNIEIFKQSVLATIERFEILRTIFKKEESGEVKQYIVPFDSFDFQIQTYNSKDENDYWLTLIQEDISIEFDLEKGPLIRAKLFELSKGGFIFYYNMHHIITDDWSNKVLAKEIQSHYEALLRNVNFKKKPLHIQYKDYAVWQLKNLKSEKFKEHRNYWKQKLSGELSRIDLTSKKVRPKFKTNNGKKLRVFLSAPLTRGIDELTLENNGSLFISLLSFINVALYKYTSQSDIIIGTPIEGRNQLELLDQIGFFVNTTPLRNIVDPSDSFLDFYEKVKNSTLESYKHSSYPFDQIVDALGLDYDMSRTPIYDVSITLHEEQKGNSIGVKKEPSTIMDMGTVSSKNDIEFHFQKVADQILLELTYNEDVYDQKLMEGLVIHFQQLVKNVIATPKETIKQLDLLNESEKEELLFEFNDTKLEIPEDTSILELFNNQVLKKPNNTAVFFENKTLTYKELDEITNRLGNCLIEKYKVTKGDFVGVHLERSEWAIIAILAILKSGCAYVFIDPTYPEGRKQFIVEDANINLILVSSTYMFDMDFYPHSLLTLDIEFSEEDYSIERPKVSLSSENIGYVIYTSGSTGIPKGVEITHNNLVSSIYARNNFYDGLNSYLLVPSFSFDSSVAVIWDCLTNGSTLYVVSDFDLKDLTFIESLIIQERIEGILCVPSYYEMILNHFRKKPESMKRIILAGESLKEYIVQKHYDFLPSCKLYNEYGPTENTVWSTVTEIEKDVEVITIGSPIANTVVYILDKHGKLVPKGVTGEIYVSGKNVAKGYLNRPELNDQKFLYNKSISEERLYKTGDLGRWTQNGTIEFIGRDDDQVKINGYRIELGEIENKLLEIDGVDQSVVLINENGNVEKEIIAFIVLSDNNLTIPSLRKLLSENTLSYMLPNHIIEVDEMKLTHNGKIDKKGLLRYYRESYLGSKNIVSPRNELEVKLVEAWKEALGKSEIGIEDDFFEIGGTSLKLIEILMKLSKDGIKIEVQDFINNLTIKEIAALTSDKVLS
ncbi:non-ribosomal peptide synthetase [Aquimarina sp. Aq107]|uniref:non-ribosomal peptide synthetase n=1 Tax=Aquimarina sp. Aq107 TaxID=1191912 RepID=UPI000D559508|nr:non-ribosomal peptide synthetase [Aquimarina sp. Aq107]